MTTHSSSQQTRANSKTRLSSRTTIAAPARDWRRDDVKDELRVAQMKPEGRSKPGDGGGRSVVTGTAREAVIVDLVAAFGHGRRAPATQREAHQRRRRRPWRRSQSRPETEPLKQGSQDRCGPWKYQGVQAQATKARDTPPISPAEQSLFRPCEDRGQAHQPLSFPPSTVPRHHTGNIRGCF